MKKQIIVLVISVLSLTLVGLKALNAQESGEGQAKSVAWYVANLKDARTKNQLCHDTPNLQGSLDCQNALHALEITFKGGN